MRLSHTVKTFTEYSRFATPSIFFFFNSKLIVREREKARLRARSSGDLTVRIEDSRTPRFSYDIFDLPSEIHRSPTRDTSRLRRDGFRMRCARGCVVCDRINLHFCIRSPGLPSSPLSSLSLTPLAVYFSPLLPPFFRLSFVSSLPRPRFFDTFRLLRAILLLCSPLCLFCLHLALSFGHSRTPTDCRWFLLNPPVLYSNCFELSPRPLIWSLSAVRVVAY